MTQREARTLEIEVCREIKAAAEIICLSELSIKRIDDIKDFGNASLTLQAGPYVVQLQPEIAREAATKALEKARADLWSATTRWWSVPDDIDKAEKKEANNESD